MTDPRAAASAGPNPVAELIQSAARWIDEALRAWASDDYGKVAALAPLAERHLGTAVGPQPVLLVPLGLLDEKRTETGRPGGRASTTASAVSDRGSVRAK